MAYGLAFQRLFRYFYLSAGGIAGMMFPGPRSFKSTCEKTQPDYSQGFRTFEVLVEPIGTCGIGCNLSKDKVTNR